MGLFKKSSGKKGNDSPSFSDKDNKGTRQNTLEQAIAYWNMRNMRQKFDPFVLYVLDNEAEARHALLELDCIHETKDKKLICLEPIIFGYYRTEAGKYEVIVAGESLSHDVWQEALVGFDKHGGKCKNDQEPEKQAAPEKKKTPDFKGKIRALGKTTERGQSGTKSTYEDYECEDAELAKEFLMTKSVDEAQYYITVKTPMGTWGMDIKGLYKERLLPWQLDIGSAKIEGQAFGLADDFSLGMAARGLNDNFVISIKCGGCGHHWLDGVRYQNWTVVECPSCHKRNKVHSGNFNVIFT